jgi:hypothetical protein
MSPPTSLPLLSAKDQRRRRIERQLRALRVMQSHLSTKEIWWAILTIPGVAILCLLVAAKLHWLSGSMPAALVGALAAGLVVWWIGRRWLIVAWLIVIALICILLEDIPNFSGFGSSDDKKKPNMDRREKLERAIARREALLRSMTEAETR